MLFNMGEFSNVYRTVKSNVRSYGPITVDLHEMAVNDRALKAVREQNEYNKKVMAANELRLKQKEMLESRVALDLLNVTKSKILNESAKKIPDKLLFEVFSNIYIKAFDKNPVIEGDFNLIDRPYIIDNYMAFRNMAEMYIRKIGGYEHLKQVAMESTSPFIKNLYKIITEATKNAMADRNKKASKCLTETEVREMIQPKPTDKEREEVLKRIDSLGADELAELVHSKVVKVVADVGSKAKQEQEFQNLLKSDLKDGGALVEPSQISNTSNGDSVAPPSTSSNAGSEDPASMDEDIDMRTGDDDMTSDVDEPASKDGSEDPNKGNNTSKEKAPAKQINDKNKKNEVKEVTMSSLYETYDPITSTFTYNKQDYPRSLYRSMLQSSLREAIYSTTESYNAFDVSNVPKKLLNNPVNLDIFRTYLAENSVKPYEYHTRQTSNEVIVDENIREKVVADTIIQYTLIETAHTMKLINVSQNDIAEQCKYLNNCNK